MDFEFEDKDVKLLSQFSGLRNTVRQEELEASDLVAALNVDITDALHIRRRAGYGKILDGSYHSLWSDGDTALVISNGSMYRYLEDNTIVQIREGLQDLPMAYDSFAGQVYFSNGVDKGSLVGGSYRSWGIDQPLNQPDVSVIGGSLLPGRYQYAITFTRDDASESGTGVAGVLDISSPSGIAFSNLPTTTDNSVTGRKLYVSQPNGETLFLLAKLSMAETVTIHAANVPGLLPIETQHLSPPPPGTIVTEHYGIIYVAVGNKLFYSLPYAPELFDLRTNFTFSSRVTMAASVQDGIYVATEDKIVFLPGQRAELFKSNEIANYGVIPGTLSYCDAADIAPEMTGTAAVFASTQGICCGLPNGVLKNFTKARYSYGATPRGTGIVRKYRGSIQYLAVLQGTESAANSAE